MNALTQIRNQQRATAREVGAGLGEGASWHAQFRGSAYVYAGGLPFELTEGDLLAVFAQYGEVVDVNLVRDQETGKSRGFAFLAYEDQRSTNLAVDNLNGTRVAGRTLQVDHVADYKRKLEDLGLNEQDAAEPADGWATERRPPRLDPSAAPVVRLSESATAAAAGGANPWEAPDSVFALMRREAEEPAAAEAEEGRGHRSRRKGEGVEGQVRTRSKRRVAGARTAGEGQGEGPRQQGGRHGKKHRKHRRHSAGAAEAGGKEVEGLRPRQHRHRRKGVR